MDDPIRQSHETMLVVRSQLGDERAFGELLRVHGPRLLFFVRQMMSAAPDRIEDLAQEIWVAIFRGLPSLRDTAKFRSWSFRIARGRVYREHRRRRPLAQGVDSDELEQLAGEAPDEPFLDREVLHAGLGSLSPEHREVIVLHFFEDLSYEEISRVTRCALGTVRSRIYYGKRALRRALENPLNEFIPDPIDWHSGNT